MQADEQRRQPGGGHEHHPDRAGGRHDDQGIGTSGEQPPEGPAQGRGGLGGLLQTVDRAADRLPDRQLQHHGHDQAGRARDHEGGAPAPPLVDEAAHQEAEEGAERHGRIEQGDGRRAPLVREVVGDQRLGRRGAAGFADADPHADQEQGGVVDRQPAGHRQAAPGQPRHRQAHQRIEQGEGRPGQKAELGVGDVQLALDGFGEDVDDGAVELVERIDDQQDDDDVPVVAPCGRFRLGRRGFGHVAFPLLFCSGVVGRFCGHAPPPAPGR